MENYNTTTSQLINTDLRLACRLLLSADENAVYFFSESNARLRVALKNGDVYTTPLQNEIDRMILTEMLFAGKFE